MNRTLKTVAAVSLALGGAMLGGGLALSAADSLPRFQRPALEQVILTGTALVVFALALWAAE